MDLEATKKGTGFHWIFVFYSLKWLGFARFWADNSPRLQKQQQNPQPTVLFFFFFFFWWGGSVLLLACAVLKLAVFSKISWKSFGFPCHLDTASSLLLRVYFYSESASADLKPRWCGEVWPVPWWQRALRLGRVPANCSLKQKFFSSGCGGAKNNQLQFVIGGA